MNSHPTVHRIITGSLSAILAVATLAPAAYAGHGWGQTQKFRRGDDCGRVFTRVTYVPRTEFEFRHHSSGGSTLAGFIGGLAVGAILTNATQQCATAPPRCAPAPVYERQSSYCPPPRDDYSYEDPYCRERFSSLDLYLCHAKRNCHHALVAQVIDNRDGDCVDVIRFNGDHWESCDRGNWDDRGQGDDQGD